LSADALAQVLRPLREIFDPAAYPELLVGLEGPEDAAVWRLGEDQALVVTTDFFTPVVDDPYDYGAIAAANSLSDVYAMGARPFLALNIAALPDDLPVEISTEIIRGGADKAREARVVIAGGHSIKDKEPKYGLVVLGLVDPHKLLRKGGLKPGDSLVITKPLGFGVTTTALKQQQAKADDVRDAVDWMKRLNKKASELAVEFDLRACTDITGFSLLGHGLEMAEASGLELSLNHSQVPFLAGARSYAEKGIFPGGAFDNLRYFRSRVRFDEQVDDPGQLLLFDPQTSGGLLLGVPRARLDSFLVRAKEIGQPVWLIGKAEPGEGLRIVH